MVGEKNFEELNKQLNSNSKFFSFVASNPPYQKSVEGNKTMMVAVYHKFMTVAKSISLNTSMIYPSKWIFGGTGEGLKEFRENEVKSPQYSSYYDFSDGSSIFPHAEIKGGVNFFLWEKLKNNPGIKYFYNMKKMNKNYIVDNDNLHVRDPKYNNIIQKINPSISLSSIISPRGFYGTKLGGYNDIEKLPKLNNNDTNKVKVFYVKKLSGLLSRNVDSNNTKREVNDWKIFVGRTADPIPGKNMRRQNRIFIGKPGEISSDTFLKIGSFDNEKEAINCLRYIKTDFALFCFAVLVNTQNTTSASYKLVPNVNFKSGEILDKPGKFLDFNKPETLDEQLVKIYDLTKGEVKLMFEDLKPWKDKLDADADK